MLRRALFLAAVLMGASQVHASPVTPRWFAGFALGAGAGDADVDGARLEFGRGPLAVGMAVRAGRVLGPDWLLAFQIDAVGAGSGDVVLLTPVPPSGPVPLTTTHRVAVNHYSVVATWRPKAGPLFVRAGPGLAESFTEDWDAVDRPVRRSFGPGVTAGLGATYRLENRARVSLNLDGMGGRYGGRSSWGAMVTLGIESF